MEDYIKIDAQKEKEKSELAVFWDELSSHLPRNIERAALGDEKIFLAFRAVYPKIKSHILTEARKKWLEDDIAYWKNIFDNPPKREKEYPCDNCTMKICRIEIERLEAELQALTKQDCV